MVQEPLGPMNRAFHSQRQVGRERFLATMPWQPTIMEHAMYGSPDVAVPPYKQPGPKFSPSARGHNGHNGN